MNRHKAWWLMAALAVLVGTVGLPTSAVATTSEEVMYYIDVGHENGDPEIAEGFGPAHFPYYEVAPEYRDAYVCNLVADYPDYTVRNQRMGQNNTIRLHGLTPGYDVQISFCVGDGAAQDAWELYVNYGTDCSYPLAVSSDEASFNGVMREVTTVIPGFYVIDNSEYDNRAQTIDLTFHNISTDVDGAGIWGILVYQKIP